VVASMINIAVAIFGHSEILRISRPACVKKLAPSYINVLYMPSSISMSQSGGGNNLNWSNAHA